MAYNDAEAQKEAESFGMCIVYLGLLKKGPDWTPDETPEVLLMQHAHLENIGRMAEIGKLSIAGPVPGGEEIRGFYVFKTGSFDEALELANTDPAVNCGRLLSELYPWMVQKGVLP